MFEDADIISAYTQAQAIEDGVLAPVDPKIAREAGFKIPVVLTTSVHALCDYSAEGGQSYTGRLWDVLNVAAQAYRAGKMRLPANATEDQFREALGLIKFSVRFWYPPESGGPRDVIMWMTFSGVDGFTIMLPEDY